jgi:hypothetical protein
MKSHNSPKDRVILHSQPVSAIREQYPRIRSLIFGICAFVVAAAPASAQVQSTLFLEPGGVLNGQSINTSSPLVTVDPGQAIAGTVNVQTTVDPSYSDDVIPLGYTATWGDRTAQPALSVASISTGVNNYGISIDQTAPTTPGNYYIPIAFSYEITIGQVMSATWWNAPNSPVWYDGNDLGWDWTSAQYQSALQNGYETQPVLGSIGQDAVGQSGPYTILNQPATWVEVEVVPEPSTLALTILGGVLLFVALGNSDLRQRDAKRQVLGKSMV